MDSLVRRLRALSPLQADGLRAALLAVLLSVTTTAVPYHHGYRHTDALALVLAALSALALTFRRRAPVGTWALSLAPVLVYQARNYQGSPALLSPLVALYTIATIQPRLRSLAFALVSGMLMTIARLAFASEAAGTLVTDAIGFIGAAVFLGWAVASRRAHISAMQDRAQRAERLRIARELHDAIAHSIATISVQAAAAEHVIDKHPEQAAEALGVIKHTSRHALAELREILGVLRQDDGGEPRDPMPGLGRLGALIQSSRQGGVEVLVRVDGQARPLPTAVDLAAYRIVQESLTNVARHAGSDSAEVRIVYLPSELELSIVDQGNGRRFTSGAGHGLAGMRERAQALGGTLHAGPRRGGGFEVRATLPLVLDPGG